MRATFTHLSLNVTDLGFYKDLLAHLGFRVVAEYKYGFGVTDGTVGVWVFKAQPQYQKGPFHRKAIGVNHIAFRTKSRGDVDALYRDYLLPRKIPVLYGGSRGSPRV